MTEGCHDDRCITCSDGAVRMRVERAPAGDGLALCGEAREPVDVTLVEPVEPGQLVLVHAGVALALLEDGGA